MNRVLHFVSHGTEAAKGLGPVGWSLVVGGGLVVAAYAFAVLRIFGLLGSL